MLIDSHFHYPSMLEKDKTQFLDRDLVGLEIGLDGGDLERRIRLVGKNRNIFLSVGAGPWILDRNDFISIDREIGKIEDDIIAFGADAIGEIGFDNHWGYGTKELQLELFERQVNIARMYKLPVAIHSREADNELLEAIDRNEIDDRTILHCFSSGLELCKKLLNQGAYISFAGNVSYKNSKAIQECALYVPLDRLLVETDSPYLTPSPRRGEINNPRNTELVIDFIASIRNIARERIKESAIENFYALMGRRESIVKRDIATID